MIADWFLFRSETSPESIAIITSENEKAYTYKDIQSTASVGASYFQSRGIKKGDRIAIIAYNCIEYIYLFSIAQKLGIVLVPINYRLTNLEIRNLLVEIDPILILVDSDHTFPHKEDSRQHYLSTIFNKINAHNSREFISPELRLEDPIFILYTSGSSGLPKGVLYTHQMMFWNSINTIMSVQITAQTSTVVCMPPFHTGGWNVLLTPLLHLGGTCILTEKFESERVLSLLEKYNCQIFMGVPTMLKMMANHPTFQSTNLTALNYILVGGEAMPEPLIELFYKKNVFIRQGYGMTEAGPNLTSLHERDSIRKIGSIGKPNMYVRTRILKEDGSASKSGERGELQIKGPITFKGYLNQPEETAKVLKDGWLSTGDIAIRDDEGFLYIVDRIKNMFISGGENVYPAEIERVLKSHPYISEVVVIAEPNEQWGESGKAIISLHANRSLSLQEMQSFCKDKLSKYKIPKAIKVVKALPKNDAGKLDRKRIVAMYTTNRKSYPD